MLVLRQYQDRAFSWNQEIQALTKELQIVSSELSGCCQDRE